MEFWDDWVDAKDMPVMWSHSEVRGEWLASGHNPASKVPFCKDSDGQVYLTQTEMWAVAEIVSENYFENILDPLVLCAIAEVESSRRPLSYRYEPELKEASTGLMQVLQSTADWLARDMGYAAYAVDWTSTMLYKPFVSVYYGAAYLKWLSTYEQQQQDEGFIVRAYNTGPRNTSSRAGLNYWNKYRAAKRSLQLKRELAAAIREPAHTSTTATTTGLPPNPGQFLAGQPRQWLYWEERASEQDMAEMWQQLDVKEEWIKAGERPGSVRFSRDSQLRPFLTRTELRAVARIVVSRYFVQKPVKPAMLCTLAEISSRRLVDIPNGIMQTSFSTALWLYSDLGYSSYELSSVQDFNKPFVSMYFGAAYVCWLSRYKYSPRDEHFIVQAYKTGPQGIGRPEAAAFYLKYMEALPAYLV